MNQLIEELFFVAALFLMFLMINPRMFEDWLRKHGEYKMAVLVERFLVIFQWVILFILLMVFIFIIDHNLI
ncbi:MAG: hypothetical protein CMC65_06455 [Flavobacteriaceae bacterium]|jgi:hypothetical protein|nr:hypothetical protein [Flavobacteriaceae bacterium]MDG1328981.1 hypothetical protein [Flavobacteriaceae bacterium]|tara:strand:- start:10252 stop:10464 length:213 start_codon:yes stop_codon:yes gene_type:complete